MGAFFGTISAFYRMVENLRDFLGFFFWHFNRMRK